MEDGSKTTTEEALLGLLSLKPMSGYEIKQMIEGSIGYFWRESFGQIYPTLKRLEKGGWIAAEKVTKAEAVGGRASRRYRITALGLERLQAWLPVPARPQIPRNELLLKLFFGAHAPEGAVRAQIEAARAIYVADLKRYTHMTMDMWMSHRYLPGFNYWLMTLRFGRAQAKAMLAWADEALAELEGLESSRAVSNYIGAKTSEREDDEGQKEATP